MAYTNNAAEYFCEGGATNDEIDDLFFFCSTFNSLSAASHWQWHREL